MIQGKKATSMVAAALLAGASTMAQADEQRVLKLSQPFAASHWHYTQGAKRFQDAVTKATNGKIQWQSYHAGQLGKEATSMLSSGIVDMANIPASYEPAKLPLTSVVELPGMFSSACAGTAKYWHLAKEGGALSEAEYKPLGLKILYVFVHAPYQVMTTKKKITSMSDVAGLKIRANGSAMDKSVRALNAVPVRVAGTEFYDAFTRGTVDGGLLPISTVRPIGLEKVVHYATENAPLSTASVMVAIRQKTWDSLSPDVQAAMTKAAAETQQYICNWIAAEDVRETDVMVKEQNLVVTRLSKEEVARWEERLRSVPAEWAKETDAAGKPGTALLKAFREAPAN